MDREKFLKLAKDFDENYTPLVQNKYLARQEIKIAKAKDKVETKYTIKKIMETKDNLRDYSQLNYSKLRNFTYSQQGNKKVGETDKTIFDIYLYNMKDEQIIELLHAIHITELFLKYYELYELDRNRSYAEKDRLVKIYQKVIEDMEIIDGSKSTIKELKLRISTITNEGDTQITKRRIFENLLYQIYKIQRVEESKKEIKSIPRKVNELTNIIIADYFSIDITFSRATKIKDFEEYAYAFGHRTLNGNSIDSPLTLYHR